MKNAILILAVLVTFVNVAKAGEILSFFDAFSNSIDASKVKIERQKYFTKSFRIIVNASISDSVGIYEARTYFKHSMTKNYQVYAPMTCRGNSCFTELPLTDASLMELDFVVVYQNSAGEVIKSDPHTMEKRDLLELPIWQSLNKKAIQLYTDYAKPMQSIRGFRDKINIKKSTGDRLGVAVGLYPLELIAPEVNVDCPPAQDINESLKKAEDNSLISKMGF